MELDANDIAPVVRAYLTATETPWVSRAFPVSSTATDGEIRAHAAQMAVFRLDQEMRLCTST
ncbi:MAG: hypothetical protein ACRDMV_01245 [Streptosporangiales bacterium]